MNLLKQKLDIARCSKVEKCKTLKMTIQSFQNIIICLKRFTSTFDKINTMVSMPIDSLIMESKLEGKLMKYSLSSIINHYGSYFGGHYNNYSKNKGKWLCFDDDDVSEVKKNIVTSNAYILFYMAN